MTTKTWQLQEAKNKLSQVIDLAIKESPQLITKNGKAAVYIVSAETFQNKAKPSIKSTLLSRPHKEITIEWERNRDTGRDIEL